MYFSLFEVQWERSVAAALSELQAEFEWQNALVCFREMCPVGQVCFLRELKSKAVRILAHKKRKLKGKLKEKAGGVQV